VPISSRSPNLLQRDPHHAVAPRPAGLTDRTGRLGHRGRGPALIPHGEPFDSACSDEAWTTPHPTTQIENVLPAVADDHCVVCHLQRAVRDAFTERLRAVPAADVKIAAAAFGEHAVVDSSARAIAARAPPIVLLSSSGRGAPP
jgi:hypothetical protein